MISEWSLKSTKVTDAENKHSILRLDNNIFLNNCILPVRARKAISKRHSLNIMVPLYTETSSAQCTTGQAAARLQMCETLGAK